MRFGILLRLSALWIGAHYSPAARRWCINPLPCVTIWIALPGGLAPGELRAFVPSCSKRIGS